MCNIDKYVVNVYVQWNGAKVSVKVVVDVESLCCAMLVVCVWM